MVLEINLGENTEGILPEQPIIPCDEPPIKSMDMRSFKVVAVVGQAKDYAIYVGPAEWEDDRVASDGMKLGERAARELAREIPELSIHWYFLTYRE